MWLNNALIRCKAFYYKLNFHTEGVFKDVEGATGILLVKRMLDIRKHPHILCWAVSSMACRVSESSRVKEMIDQAMDVVIKREKEERKKKEEEPEHQFMSNSVATKMANQATRSYESRSGTADIRAFSSLAQGVDPNEVGVAVWQLDKDL